MNCHQSAACWHLGLMPGLHWDLPRHCSVVYHYYWWFLYLDQISAVQDFCSMFQNCLEVDSFNTGSKWASISLVTLHFLSGCAVNVTGSSSSDGVASAGTKADIGMGGRVLPWVQEPPLQLKFLGPQLDSQAVCLPYVCLQVPLLNHWLGELSLTLHISSVVGYMWRLKALACFADGLELACGLGMAM